MKVTYSNGFTLVELVIVIAILGIVSAIAMPEFQSMIINAQTKTATESIVNGLQKARAEAVTRNANVEFVIAADVSWTVRTPAGVTIQSRRNDEEGSANTTVITNASTTTATFNSFGSLADNADTSDRLSQVDVSTTNGTRPLRVQIGVGGGIRMCDPRFASGSNARAC